MIALTQKRGNPASALASSYAELMAIEDTDRLCLEALTLVKGLVGRGFSTGKHDKFARDLRAAQRCGLDRVRFFLTNFMLAADGLRVIT